MCKSQGVVAGQQTCKVCLRVDRFNFHVPDEVWLAVVPMQYQNRVVCLACFDQFSEKRQVDYSTCLESLYFAGDYCSFEFKAISCSSRPFLLPCTRCTTRHT
jgi:hypothetical protein